MKKSFLFAALLFAGFSSFSQNITGSWYGRADVVMEGLHNNYLTELILKQKGDEVEGVLGYYFKNMYQSIFVRGTYDKKTRQVTIKDIPLIHFRSSVEMRTDCPMDFKATLMVSKAKSSLQGFFLRHEKYKYTCPDMRVSYTMDSGEINQDSILKSFVIGQKIWSPLPEDIVYTDNNQSIVASNAGTVDSAAKEPAKELVSRFEARKNIFQKEIVVSSDSLRISFYDNGDIDGDSISVFMNGQPILARKELDIRGVNLYVKLDTTRAVNEISMFAENLGKYPPNTALMVVYDGDTRNEIYLSSSLTQNATVRIRRK